MRHPNVAVIGLGFMGRTHIQSLRRLGLGVYGVAGINEEEASKVAAELSIGKWYSNFPEALADPAVEVVHLCTPNNLHYEQAKAALEAGKHVFCEKPLAMTSAESRELAALAKKKGLMTAVNYNLRFYPICQEARARVQGGELGSALSGYRRLPAGLALPEDGLELAPGTRAGRGPAGGSRYWHPLDGPGHLHHRTEDNGCDGGFLDHSQNPPAAARRS